LSQKDDPGGVGSTPRLSTADSQEVTVIECRVRVVTRGDPFAYAWLRPGGAGAKLVSPEVDR
jgi:hypothetical protein